MISPIVFNTSEICRSFGVTHAVFSPGSRNAPLAISFARNEQVKKWIIPDERAAGFVALGIAQKTKSPVVLCCTSGSALLNYAPAIAEAYYREVPLLILSADRPPELIDQRDGQTIRQFESLKNHVKASYQLPVVSNPEDEVKYRDELLLGLSMLHQLPLGPIHVNIPFKEPFYPSKEQKLHFQSIPNDAVPRTVETDKELELPKKEIFHNKKVLIVLGQQPTDDDLNHQLSQLNDTIPILGSPLNNYKGLGVRHTDFFLDDQEELKPEVLITTGLSVLSKKLKNFIRKKKPKLHYHFDPSGVYVDTYQTKPKLITISLKHFLKKTDLSSVDPHYIKNWSVLQAQTADALEAFSYPERFTETEAFQYILENIPEHSELHLSNSMPVRFAELFGVSSKLEAWCNRGTSGIDGCTSTAMGTAFVSDKMNILLTGELAFLYDRNAFFHNYSFPNLRIIVSNNQGGGIFRLIDGPSALPELEAYFETQHDRSARYICEENDFSYSTADTRESLREAMADFFEPSKKPKLLEIFTQPKTNEQVFKDLKRHIHEQINH